MHDADARWQQLMLIRSGWLWNSWMVWHIYDLWYCWWLGK